MSKNTCQRPCEYHALIKQLKAAGVFVSATGGVAVDLTIKGSVSLDNTAKAALCDSLSDCSGDVFVTDASISGQEITMTLSDGTSKSIQLPETPAHDLSNYVTTDDLSDATSVEALCEKLSDCMKAAVREELDKYELTLKDIVAPDAPTAEQEEGVIAGTAEPNSTVTLYDKNNSVVSITKTNSNGDYMLESLPVDYNGQTLVVTATDAEGNESEATSVNIMFKGVPSIPESDVAPEVFVNGISPDCASGSLEISINTDAYVTATDSSGVTVYAGVLSPADTSISLNRPIVSFENVTLHAVNSMGSNTYNVDIMCM